MKGLLSILKTVSGLPTFDQFSFIELLDPTLRTLGGVILNFPVTVHLANIWAPLILVPKTMSDTPLLTVDEGNSSPKTVEVPPAGLFPC